jgi:ribA/ribD-fused uncharacterized protein
MKAKMLGAQRKDDRWGKTWQVNKKTDHRLVNDVIDMYSDVKIDKNWDKRKNEVMIDACIAKFSIQPFKNNLMRLPVDTILVEHSRKDSYWGDGGDINKGKNMLGKILTVISRLLNRLPCPSFN